MRIMIHKVRLSDGSHVFNVFVPETMVHAASEAEAQRFADTLAALCNEYNVNDDDAEVRFSY